jgi:hypothetical protein
VIVISLVNSSKGDSVLQRLPNRFGASHDPANFIYHYPGCAPVEVGSRDPTDEVFVIQLADRVWDVKFKVDSATFKPVIAAMVAHQDDRGDHDQEAARMVQEHGATIVRACSEFCELNLLISLQLTTTH